MLFEFTEKCAALLPGNRVEICSADAEALGVGNYDRVLVRSGDAGYICAVRANDDALRGTFRTTKKVYEGILGKRREAEITALPCLCFDKVFRTAYSKRRQPLITVGPNAFDKMKSWPGRRFALVNKLNGEVFVFSPSDVSVDPSLEDKNGVGTGIKMSRLVRKFLLLDEKANAVTTKNQNLRIYPAAWRELSAVERVKGFFTRLVNGICGFFVGKAEAQLKTFRPSDNDEDKNVIRLTGQAMTVLGINEGDNVYLEYKGRIKSVKVWAFDEKEKEREYLTDGKAAGYERERAYLTEHPNELVGIPWRLRRLMDINDLGVNVKVRRNCAFLFRKKILLSVLSVFALLISAEMLQFFSIFAGWPLVWKMVSGAAALALLLYIVMTEERGKVK